MQYFLLDKRVANSGQQAVIQNLLNLPISEVYININKHSHSFFLVGHGEPSIVRRISGRICVKNVS